MRDFFADLEEAEPSAATGFAGGRLDRASEQRAEDAVAEAVVHPAARIYVFRGDQVQFDGTDPQLRLPAAEAMGAKPADMVLLGWKGEEPRLAVSLPATGDGSTEAGRDPADLRSLAVAGDLPAEILGELALARALSGWHIRHRFCANCGAATTISAGGLRRDCGTCGAMHFPRTDPVVIMLAIDGERALLGRSARFAPGVYSCLAGFMEPGETIEDAVRRETAEESGIRLGRVCYHASQPWPFPSSLMIGCHGEALTTDISLDDDELEDCRWFDVGEVRAMAEGTHAEGFRLPPPMAIAHHLISAWVEG